MPDVTPEVLLRAYKAGIFPMSESCDDPDIFWVDPRVRGILPVENFHVPRRLKRTVRSERFEITINMEFKSIMEGCAASVGNRPKTWINGQIIELYTALHDMGFAHSIECWRNGLLSGGLYGIALGGVFFGESMFSRERDSSKVALVHLIARMRAGNFMFVDTQFISKHLSKFGAIEISRSRYQSLLKQAISIKSNFNVPIDQSNLDLVLDTG